MDPDGEVPDGRGCQDTYAKYLMEGMRDLVAEGC